MDEVKNLLTNKELIAAGFVLRLEKKTDYVCKYVLESPSYGYRDYLYRKKGSLTAETQLLTNLKIQQEMGLVKLPSTIKIR